MTDEHEAVLFNKLKEIEELEAKHQALKCRLYVVQAVYCQRGLDAALAGDVALGEVYQEVGRDILEALAGLE